MILIALILFFFFGFLPGNKKLNELRKDLESVQNKLEKARKEVTTLPIIYQKIEEAKSSFSSLNKKLPDTVNIPEIVDQLSRELNKLDIKLISLAPDVKEKVKEEEIGRLDIEIIAHFTYLALANYLGSVSKLPLLFKVQDLKIEKDEKIAPYLMVHLIMSSYFLSTDESGK
ncbi:MAG: type 4a pilus biogenesis protein PilO [bacterium]